MSDRYSFVFCDLNSKSHHYSKAYRSYQEAIAASRLYALEQICLNATQAVVLVNSADKIVYANSGAIELFGGNTIGINISELESRVLVTITKESQSSTKWAVLTALDSSKIERAWIDLDGRKFICQTKKLAIDDYTLVRFEQVG